jgi:hypothetical protein
MERRVPQDGKGLPFRQASPETMPRPNFRRSPGIQRKVSIVAFFFVMACCMSFLQLHTKFYDTQYLNQYQVDVRGLHEILRKNVREKESAPVYDHLLQQQQRELHNKYPNSTSPFAYAFVIGGCDPDYAPSYQNYIFNIVVAAKILMERGSKADVVVLLQVSNKARHQRLPRSDVRLLHALGVYVYYFPQQTEGTESFYRTQLDKFRILSLTQYQRILYMDGDIMPLANLDYLFECSVNGTIRENLVIRGIYEPANGGFFMLQPGSDLLDQVIDTVSWREATAKELPYPHFDEIVGWGQPLALNDPWISERRNGTNYTFLAAFADQGLLYHYTKYVRQSVSIVLPNGVVEHWVPPEMIGTKPTTTTRPTRTVATNASYRLFDQIGASQGSNRLLVPGRHNRFGSPRHSFVHFTGERKPWMGGPPGGLRVTNATCLENGKNYWFWKLQDFNDRLQIGLDFHTHWRVGEHLPPLGLYPVQETVLLASTNLRTPLVRDYPHAPDEYRVVVV